MRTGWTRSWKQAGLLVAFVVLLPATSWAQPKAQTIDIVPRADLSFGSIIASPGGGTVTVTPDGLRTTAGVFGFGAMGYNAAEFEVTVRGTGNPHYQIVLPAAVTLTSGGRSMVVDSFLSDPAGTGTAKPPAGTERLRVGATLRVGPNQREGTYQGSYLVTVHLMN